jgi:hypothetical protein
VLKAKDDDLDADIAALTAALDGHVTVLKAQADGLDGHVTVLKAWAGDLGGGAPADDSPEALSDVLFVTDPTGRTSVRIDGLWSSLLANDVALGSDVEAVYDAIAALECACP